MKDLMEYSSDPRALEKDGFNYRQEAFDGPHGHAWLERRLTSAESQVGFTLQIEFEMDIDGHGNHYSFNGVWLAVADRRMERANSMEFDEESESPRDVGRWPLPCRTLEEVEELCRLLGNRHSTPRC